MPKISIIVATYNAESCLETALKSVCALSYKDWECVVVDGLSKDRTMNIVRQYADKDSRISYISEPDKGIYDAFNKGWKMAEGEYIYYLGADDYLYPNAFDCMNDQSYDADILYGRVDFGLGKEIIKETIVYNPRNLLHYNFCSHQAILMKRSVIEAMGGFNTIYRICADFDLLQRAYLSSRTFACISTNFGIHDVKGVSSGFSSEKDCYLIRRNNQSVSAWKNMLLSLHSYYMCARRKIVFGLKYKLQQ